jgi:flagellar biosynthesis repressor protein FlbT
LSCAAFRWRCRPGPQGELPQLADFNHLSTIDRLLTGSGSPHLENKNMALKISLKPHEKFVVNGAVITNGDRRSAFIINNKVSILREKDIMTADDITTPARRIYFPIMLAYLEPDNASKYYEEFVHRMTEFMNVIDNPDVKMLCVDISLHVMQNEYYRALTQCRKLIDYETVAFASLAQAA